MNARTLIPAVAASVAFSLVSAGAGAQCSARNDAMASPGAVGAAMDAGDIVETAIAAGSFETLLAAAEAAGLVEALKGEGPLTVFAPTDEAFGNLPAGTVESLLKPENKEMLKQVLLFHVLDGEFMAADVATQSGATTLQGQRAAFTRADQKLLIDGASIVKGDIECSNGVIHVIDTVILPAQANLVEVAGSAGQFNTLLAAAKAAGLVEALTGKGPFTVLAPTDDAFANLPKGTVESLLQPQNRDKLATILKDHVIPGRIYARDAITTVNAKTLEGTMVNFDIRDGRLTVNGASVIGTDIDASNGVIHIIDSVILPQGK